MEGKTYSFKVGDIEMTVLLDGVTQLGVDGIMNRFPESASEADYRAAFESVGQPLEEADDYFNILLARMGDEVVLVDTGEGGRPVGGLLPESLSMAGVDPAAVTLIVITHSHGDHILGMLTDNGQPMYPNARYVVSKEEMAFWQKNVEANYPDRQPIIDMMKAQSLRLIEMDEEIIPGLTAEPITGHTPGQIALLFESNGQRFIHLADLLHSPMQFPHPEWSPRFDEDPDAAMPTRLAGLKRVTDEQLPSMLYHIRFPGVGMIEKADIGYRWVPRSEG